MQTTCERLTDAEEKKEIRKTMWCKKEKNEKEEDEENSHRKSKRHDETRVDEGAIAVIEAKPATASQALPTSSKQIEEGEGRSCFHPKPPKEEKNRHRQT